MRPFFSYYGGKYRIAPRYPDPQHGKIIEPFAGSAGYSLRYPWLKVTLYEINPKIAGIWRYLIGSSPADILSLPLVEHVDEANVCQEAKWLMGMWMGKGRASPAKSLSEWGRDGRWTHCFWGVEIRQRIANQMNRIKHWKVAQKSYHDCPEIEATWFVDPPYSGPAGKHYPNSDVDYSHLAEWCKSRRGLSIVCEMNGADWLPFEHFHHAKANNGCGRDRICHEVIWTNLAS
jgi:site-specific DNA-adenine methylase